MGGDFSRSTFDPGLHFSHVRQQQGRVTLDADWNELNDILVDQARRLTRALLGPLAVPGDDPGFALTPMSGLVLRGHSRITLDRTDGFQFSDDAPFSLAAWVDMGRTGQGVLWQRSLRDGAVDRWTVDAGGRVVFTRAAADGGLATAVATSRAIGSGLRPVAVSFDGTLLRIYIDGRLEARAAVPAMRRAGTWRVALGLADPAATVSGPGMVGTFRRLSAWSRALAGDEILELARLRAFPTAEVIADWRFFGRGESSEVRDDQGPHDGSIRRDSEQERDSWDGTAFWVTPGDAYVDGIRCRADTPTRVSVPSATGDCAAFVEVWDRLLPSFLTPRLPEPALGGEVPSLRSQVSSRVRVTSEAEFDGALDREAHKGRLRPHIVGATARRENRLYRVEIHDSGCVDPESNRGAAAVPGEVSGEGIPGLRLEDRTLESAFEGRWLEVRGASFSVLALAGRADPNTGYLPLTQRTGGFPEAGPVGVRVVPTFKWSSDNATTRLKILDHGSDALTLADDREGEPVLSPRDWLEVRSEINDRERTPGTMVRIRATADSVHRSAGDRVRVLLDPDSRIPDRFDPETGYVIRWDTPPGSGDTAVRPVRAGSNLPLEQGLVVEFDDFGHHHSGDHWKVPTREDGASLLWPMERGVRAFRGPDGDLRHIARLGTVRFGADGRPQWVDGRPRFTPVPASPGRE